MKLRALVLAGAIAAALAAPAAGEKDPYEEYVKNSKDFKPVKQDKDWALKAWPSWTYMPWSYQWTIGYDDASGKWSTDHGYNGAFLDHGQVAVGGVNKLNWIDKFKLRFYVDHIAGKYELHLLGSKFKAHKREVNGTGVRLKPVNAAMAQRLKKLIRRRVKNVMSSPNRAAYALDDEISWGHFVSPCMWQVTDDRSAYEEWLTEIHGAGNVPDRKGWIGYNSVLPKLSGWKIKEVDCGQLMDQWTFNDSHWNNFLGDLAEYSNSIDPATPCGFVGGQSPNAFGGYDYAKLMRKVQFIESYNIGGSQAVIRSFNPRNALPTVTTHFHKRVPDTVWQVWYYLAHGNRGFIGWVQGWFDGRRPKAFHKGIGPHYVEANEEIGPLMTGAEWIHDGVAIYYSQASIQLGWIFDAQAHGTTWVNRNDDHRLGSSHNVRHAWENMLRDEGLQYNFISYADVIQKGIPSEYKVLILPATICLSDVEARRIKAFCRAGGTVIADYMPGLWDQHGRGRAAGGALDDMFGVKHDPNMQARDIFGQRLWVEVDQDKNFSTWRKSYREFLTNGNTCIKHASGFNKAVRHAEAAKVNKYGKGKAVLMNLSPQWYNAYRQGKLADARKREVFTKHVKDAGLERWVKINQADEKTHGYEITYWAKDGRTIVFVCFNPEIAGSATGGGNAVGLKTAAVPITLKFARNVKDARDERLDKRIGAGDRFKFEWKMNEAVVMSFAGKPPK